MSDPTASTPVNRRQFLTAAAAVTAAVSLPILQPTPALAAKTKPPVPTDPVDVGPLTDYATDGITDKFATTPARFFVVRHEGKLFATSSICTHRFAPVTVKDGEFFCKSHGSTFAVGGEMTKGPAKTSLPRYGIKTDDKGHVIVSPGTEYSEAKWDDAASFVKVDEKK